MNAHQIEFIATSLFAAAIIHTFLVKRFQHLARKFRKGTFGFTLFHLLGEVELVFGFWAVVLVASMAVSAGRQETVRYIESLNFTEPLFVICIMVVAATRPIVELSALLISGISRFFLLPRKSALYLSCLTVGPLLGSLITEPAAMTITALIMSEHFFKSGASKRFMYLSLGTLFVNISIGGVLTHFAAPPVLMVAGVWGWGTGHMLSQFGWKAVVAVALNGCLATFLGRGYLQGGVYAKRREMSWWLSLVHLLFLGAIVATAHQSLFFIVIFLLFTGVVKLTKRYQDELKLRESLLVGLFLGGLVVLGGLQSWWISPLIIKFSPFSLFAGTAILTAFTDNAALTYLGAQVPNLAESLKYALVAGAVAGGGITVIANAPNPAGYSILGDKFGEEGISPLLLACGALIPTLIAAVCLWVL